MTDLDFITAQTRQYVHASNLISKWYNPKTTASQKEALQTIFPEYKTYLSNNAALNGYTEETIVQRVKLLNIYYNFLHSQDYDNLFSAQSKFRSTILEEFIYILLKDYVQEMKDSFDNSNVLNSGSIKAYTNLFFKAKDFKEYIKAPQIGVNTKDQDYAIYRVCNLTVNNQHAQIMIPAVAVEAKTYIDKTMLDSIIATAEKLKTGNPYTRFIAIAEHYDVGADVDPAYSRIDQIYILRKCKRREWLDIDTNVVLRIFKEIKQHIERSWSNIEHRLHNDGVIL